VDSQEGGSRWEICKSLRFNSILHN
jgi:hypothetical protein